MPRNKRVNKKKVNQQNHSVKRAKERYGIELDEITYRRLCNSIRFLGKDYKKKHYEVELIEKKSNTRSIYKVYFGDKILTVVYDKSRSQIESILPPNNRELKRHERNRQEKYF